MEDFIRQNQLPLVVPIKSETLKLLNNDERKVVLTIVDDELNEKSLKLIKILRSAATANRDLVFAYVGVKQWEDFVDTFDVNKNTKLPKVLVWDRNDEYQLVSEVYPLTLLVVFFITILATYFYPDYFHKRMILSHFHTSLTFIKLLSINNDCFILEMHLFCLELQYDKSTYNLAFLSFSPLTATPWSYTIFLV